MNLQAGEQIAKAVLYEGYMLYPYRPSSVKNRQRFNFGVVSPKAYSDAQEGTEPCSIRTECLISGDAGTRFESRIRFLHLQTRSGLSSESLPDGWQEAVEREVGSPEYSIGELNEGTLSHSFAFPAAVKIDANRDEHRQEAVEGIVDISETKISDDVYKISVQVRNLTPLRSFPADRDSALMHSLVSTHAILGVKGGQFVSLLEPPEGLQEWAASCQNVGAWPVLVGDPGQRDTMLASPIILYDYPQIAPESAGDLFDGTEIDEILSLRIMTLTEEEKREIRQSDDRARQILERTESMPAEQFMKLHGTLRNLRSPQGNIP